MSRPGAWAYPDMLEVGRLKNFTESRSHYGAWAVMSSPLILSFDLRVTTVLDAMWPIISNRDVLAVNQRWAGHPGTRLNYTGAVNGNVGNSSQTWAKPMGNSSYAVFFISTGPVPAEFSLPFASISTDWSATDKVCFRDLYTKNETGPVDATGALEATVAVHDSALYCVRPAVGGVCSSAGGCPSFPA